MVIQLCRSMWNAFLFPAALAVEVCLLAVHPIAYTAESNRQHPNVLFIAIDDLNDWVGCLEGHPQVKTPNIDRLAARGINFVNAHCQAPICMPSRASLLTSSYPHRNGVYMIEQRYDEAPLLKDRTTLPEYFQRHGYRTIGCGKIFHRSDDHGGGKDWDEFGFNKGWSWMGDVAGPQGVSGLPEPSIFDFGPLDVPKERMNDWEVADWAISQFQQPHSQPFFMAIGFNTPHLPLFTPREYFDSYPIDAVELPAVLPGDLDDLPPMGRKFTRYFDSTPMSHHNITRYGLWHKAVASYLACATFTDACVGRLLDALEASPFADNTLIVLWSDHGFHLGEKMHWEKRSLWEESTRVPLIFALPRATSTGGQAGLRCAKPVGLIDIFPTLVELCALPKLENLDGQSLVPLINDPNRPWEFPALTTHHPGNHAIRTERWRYIRYANGDQELYDHDCDPHEWVNLAGRPESLAVMKELSALIPEQCAEYAPRQPRQQFTQEFDWSRP